jgi:hypothetical protein
MAWHLFIINAFTVIILYEEKRANIHFYNVKTGTGAHAASCIMVIGCWIPGGKTAGG